jgi:hypothetical protein
MIAWHGLKPFPVIPGRAKREPGISILQSLDSGFSPQGCPGMTGAGALQFKHLYETIV